MIARRFTCRVCCETTSAEVHTAREMMYGTRETFDYLRCGSCGCLQIADIPADLGRHYPGNYYSQVPRKEPPAKGRLAAWLTRRYCIASSLRPASPLTALLRQWLPLPGDFAEFGDYLVQARLRSARERILDVGCGASPHRLVAFRRCGFLNVEGIDPFIAADTQYHGVPVRKCTIDEVTGQFGLIMFHHSLEHVPDPVSALSGAARLLRPGGICLVRVPVVGTWFWRHFGIDWVELDAPRHLHLLSQESVGRLAEQAGFRVLRTVFDSGVWELSGSIRYQRNIAMREIDPDPQARHNEDKVRPAQRRFVEQLNALGDAGRACFTLERLVHAAPLSTAGS